jgi:hypothetical protein
LTLIIGLLGILARFGDWLTPKYTQTVNQLLRLLLGHIMVARDGETKFVLIITAAMIRADILISSTGAPHTLIHADMVRSAMQERPHRSLC